MKYIIIEYTVSTKKDDSDAVEHYLPVIFADTFVHLDMAEHSVHQLHFMNRNNRVAAKVISAGFYDPVTGKCYGKSESLYIGSDEDDAKRILVFDQTHGIDDMVDMIHPTVETMQKEYYLSHYRDN